MLLRPSWRRTRSFLSLPISSSLLLPKSLASSASSPSQLTLHDLGLPQDIDPRHDDDAFLSFLPPPRPHGVGDSPERGLARSKHHNARPPSPRMPLPAASKQEPSPDEMKQAALDAARILAGIAGVRLQSSPQKSAPVAGVAGKGAHYSHEKFVDARVIEYTSPSSLPTQEDVTSSSSLASQEDVEEGSVLETLSEDESSPDEEESYSKQVYEVLEAMEEEASSEADDITPIASDISGQEQPHMGSNKVAPACQKWSHPWPEWVEFLEKLHKEGLFEATEEFVGDGKHLFSSCTAVRHAICEFGRERTDIVRSLTRKDLRVMANYSCPDLERKTSNASKRLRDHFDIPEGDVCIKCKLKMSCPRAFLTPPTAIAMTTLDVLRIVTGFATNVGMGVPDVAEKNECPQEVQASACNLLREILTLWDLPKCEESLVENPRQTKKDKRKVMQSFSVPEKPGDWVCPNCDFMNFNRNRRCKECHVCRPPQEQEMLLGDWSCPKCLYMNFSRNRYCRECKTERPTKTKWAGGERLSDDESNEHVDDKRFKHGEIPSRHAHRISRSKLSKQDGECLSDDESNEHVDDKRFKHGEIPSRHAHRISRSKLSKQDGERLSDDESNEHVDDKRFKHGEIPSRHAHRISRSKLSKQDDESEIITNKVVKKTRGKKALDKRAEKDYEASEEDEGSLKEFLCRSAVMHHSQSEMDLSDEQAQTYGSRKVPSKKVPKVLFHWSDDDEDEEKSSRALSKKVKPPKSKSRTNRKQKTTKRY